jgi:hypothetical protein
MFPSTTILGKLFFPVQNLYLASLFKKINIVVKMLLVLPNSSQNKQKN